MMALTQRLIDVTFTLASGQFGGSNGSTLKLSKHRVSAKILKAGGMAMGRAELQVFGMTPDEMNQLSTLGMQVILIPRNTVVVEAGDADNGMAVVFQGTTTNVWADFSDMPNVSLHVEASTGLGEAVQGIPPTSFNGSVDVAAAMAGFAAQMGRALENNGVNARVSNSYLYGSARNQAYALARHAGININLDDPTKLIIWPKGGVRNGTSVLVSPDTGLVGYPSFVAQGIEFRTLFNPNIAFGSKIEIKSDLQRACGTWAVYLLDHDLESMVPNGSWFSRVQAYNPNFPAPVLQ